MLFNSDICDAISEVQIHLKMNGDVANTRFYKHISDLRYTKMSHDMLSLYERMASYNYIIKLFLSNEIAGRWVLDNMYDLYKSIDPRNDVYFDGLIINLVIKYNDIEFIYYLIKCKFDAALITASMRHGTLEQIRFLYTVCDFSKIDILDILGNTARLDIMKFLYSIRPELFNGAVIRDISELSHNSRIVKRDLETLNWAISKIDFRFDSQYFTLEENDVILWFIRPLLERGDESLLEWMFINHADLIIPILNHIDDRIDTLCTIAMRMSRRVFLLAAQHIYVDDISEYHEDVIKNIRHIADKIETSEAIYKL